MESRRGRAVLPVSVREIKSQSRKSRKVGKVESRKSRQKLLIFSDESWGTSKSKVALMFPNVDSRQSCYFSSKSAESESCKYFQKPIDNPYIVWYNGYIKQVATTQEGDKYEKI